MTFTKVGIKAVCVHGVISTCVSDETVHCIFCFHDCDGFVIGGTREGSACFFEVVRKVFIVEGRGGTDTGLNKWSRWRNCCDLGCEAISYEADTRYGIFFASRLGYSRCERQSDDRKRDELEQRTCTDHRARDYRAGGMERCWRLCQRMAKRPEFWADVDWVGCPATRWAYECVGGSTLATHAFPTSSTTQIHVALSSGETIIRNG